MKSRGALAQDTLVTTVMSNLGLLQAMEREGIAVVQTAVGDRYVLEEMRRSTLSLGGEQSGHVIFLDHGTTGDGVLTGLMLAARVAETQQPLAAQLPPRTALMSSWCRSPHSPSGASARSREAPRGVRA